MQAAGRITSAVPRTVETVFGPAADEVVDATRTAARRGQRLNIAADFNALDRRITEHLRTSQTTYVRDEYGRRNAAFGERARAIVADGLESGLGRDDIAADLQAAAEGILKSVRVMPDPTKNRVREQREARGLSQIALADRAGLTRQSVGAIEAGRATPAVDVALRLARALDCSVEFLFASADGTMVGTEAGDGTRPGRVAMAHIAGRWVSYSLHGVGTRVSADGVAERGQKGRLDVESLRPLAEARENIVIMGCALGLGLVADRLNSRPGPGRFLWLPRSSTAALEALAKSHAHVAGVHLVNRRTGDTNVEAVRRHSSGTAVVLITLARWEAGLVTAPGNPKGVKRPGDLARRGLRLVTREEGSVARRLLDQHLQEAGVTREGRSTCIQATGHLEVAQTVAIGAGDVGVATRDAAIACGLEFIPLAEERFDLVVPLASMEDARISLKE